VQIKSHLIVSASLYTCTVTLTGIYEWGLSIELLISFLMMMIGTVLPDIDHPQSTIGSRFKWLSYPVTIFFGHRGITHSLLGVGLICSLALWTDTWWLYWLAFGYLGHLVGDYLTDSGVPLFWPIRKRYRFILVGSTGGISEFAMVCIVLIATGIIVWW